MLETPETKEMINTLIEKTARKALSVAVCKVAKNSPFNYKLTLSSYEGEGRRFSQTIEVKATFNPKKCSYSMEYMSYVIVKEISSFSAPIIPIRNQTRVFYVEDFPLIDLQKTLDVVEILVDRSVEDIEETIAEYYKEEE